VGGAQGKLSKGSIFLVLGELRLELGFFLVEFALFVEAAKEFLLCKIALALTFLG
jgi:hypothetical protein